MIPILYEKDETSFDSNGLGRLRDCISCVVTEERNGVYECDFEYPTDGVNYDRIQCGRIIAVTHDESGDVQPFDIVSYERPINGVVTFHAVHISYRQTALTASGTNINSLADAFTMLGNAEPSNPFNYWTDKESTGYLAAGDGVPHSVRSILGGMEGSILDAYGGEYEWDNWTVKLWANRGELKNFTIRYGVNLTDYSEDTDYSDTYNYVIPYWTGQDANGDPLIIIGNRQSSGYPSFNGTDRCIPLDVTGRFNSEDGTPTQAQVEAEGLAYIQANQPFLPAQTLKVDFVRISDTPEYAQFKSLQECKLCDSINVLFSKYDVQGTFKIVKTEYDVLNDRYLKLELGTLSISLATALGINSSGSYYVSVGGGGGGTSNYNDLSNKPSINGTTLSGNKTSANLSIHEVPSGGSTGQVLSKASGTNYDLAWVNQSDASVTDVQVNGTSVVSSGVANVPASRETVYGVVKTAFNNDPGGGVVSITHHNSGGTETTGYAPLVQYLNGDYQPIRAKLLPDATTTTKGALSAADKTKLDKVILDANDKIDPSILPTANASDYGAIKLSSGPSSIQFTYSNGSTVNAPILNGSNLISTSVMPDATTTTKGAMSATDKAIVNSIPSGGTTGQVLSKASGTDYDFTWANQSGGGISLPIGSIYERTDNTNPSTDLGNTWTLLGTTDLTSATAIGTSGGDDIVTSEGDTLGFGIVTYKFERTA